MRQTKTDAAENKIVDNQIPKSFKSNYFENVILAHVEDENDKNILKNAYHKSHDKYVIKNEVLKNDDKSQHILDIFKSLQCSDLPADSPDDKTHENKAETEKHSSLKQQLKEKDNQISELKTKINDYENLLQRKQAEFENYRKRTLKEREDFQKTANQKFIEELLPIIDNFEKAISVSNGQTENSVLWDGIILIEKQLKKALESNGLELIQSEGMEFDPNLHEALHIEESNTDYEVDTVIQEWQKGYILAGKVIRHAKVVVAKGRHSDHSIGSINNN
ncbi:MAG: nucleotide exchange factor GrpE [Spirochaetota bacterium]|nr:nucleotide exchange factor GrpE [Spirochaetota bacterium]